MKYRENQSNQKPWRFNNVKSQECSISIGDGNIFHNADIHSKSKKQQMQVLLS